MKKKRKSSGKVYSAEAQSVEELAEHSEAIRKLMSLFPNARMVVDSLQEKLLIVSQSDVEQAVPGNPAACAVAVNLAKSGFDGGLIGRNFAYVVKGVEAVRYQLNKDAQIRTGVFDNRGTMTPGPIHLSAVAPTNRLGYMERRKRISQAVIKSPKRKPKNPRNMESLKKRREVAGEIRAKISVQGFRNWDRSKLPHIATAVEAAV